MGDIKRVWSAWISVGLLLLNAFQWIVMRGYDLLLAALISVLIALPGAIFGYVALKKIRRHRSALEGESLAHVGYWGHFIICTLSFFLFCWLFLTGVLAGRYL